MPFYEVIPNQLYSTIVSSAEISFQFVKAIIAALKTSPGGACITRGSSSAGTVVAYSATPDGVDRWFGATAVEALSGSGFAWQILESTSGLQYLFAVKFDGSIYLGCAKNKFETAGAWRNAGSVTALVAPSDVTSTPEQDREVVPPSPLSMYGPYPPSAGLTSRFHVWKRVDGEGFVVVATHATGNVGQFYLGGVFKLTTPKDGDTNPYVVMCSQGGTGGGCSWTAYDNNGPTHSQIWGRVPVDGVVPYSFVEPWAGEAVYGRSDLTVDPFTGKFQALPIQLFSRAATSRMHFRGCMPGMFRAQDSHVTFDTINSASQIVFDDLIFEWDGATTPLLT
jgi:hypothetical protein